MVFISGFITVLKSVFYFICSHVRIFLFNVKYIVVITASIFFFIVNSNGFLFFPFCFMSKVHAPVKFRCVFFNILFLNFIQLVFLAFNKRITGKYFFFGMAANPTQNVNTLPNITKMLSIKEKVNACYFSKHMLFKMFYFHATNIKNIYKNIQYYLVNTNKHLIFVSQKQTT